MMLPNLLITSPAKAGVQQRPARNWAPAFGVPAKYYFAGCPFAGEGRKQ